MLRTILKKGVLVQISSVYNVVYIVRQIKLSDKIHEIKLHSNNNDSYI